MSSFFLTFDSQTSPTFTKGKWTSSEDDLLRVYVAKFGEKKWKKISDLILTRSPLQCLHRWTKILKPGMIKGPWTLDEDQKLIQWVKIYGPNKWSLSARLIVGRNGKQCRERWINHLNPNVKKGNWNEAEDEKIYQLYQKFGSAWSKIAKFFNGRSENSIKNRFYATLRKFDQIKRREEMKNLGKIELGIDSRSVGSWNTDDISQKKIDLTLENQASFFKFDEQTTFTNCWNEDELEEELCKKEIMEFDNQEIGLNQNNVMEVLNEIMEDDNRLDEKILNMIDSLKNIELEIMGKIAKNMNQENFSGKRSLDSDDFEIDIGLKKKLRLA